MLASNSADLGGSGVDTVTFQRSPAGAGTWTSQAASWNTNLQADGQYDLRVVTTDFAGNSVTSATIMFGSTTQSDRFDHRSRGRSQPPKHRLADE